MDGPMLILAKSGISTLEERTALFDALRADPAVPNVALLLLDLRNDEDALGASELGARFLGLRRALGLKLGPACAMIVRDQHHSDFRTIREMPAAHGLHLGMFADEAAAREWLGAFAPADHSGIATAINRPLRAVVN
jgi:hypothetical protein